MARRSVSLPPPPAHPELGGVRGLLPADHPILPLHVPKEHILRMLSENQIMNMQNMTEAGDFIKYVPLYLYYLILTPVALKSYPSL